MTKEKKQKSESLLRHVTGGEGFDERRKTARLNIPIKVFYRIINSSGKPSRAVTKDVSEGGCLLLVDEKLEVGSEVKLEIILGESEEETLQLKGRVVRECRIENELFEYGISFGDIGKDARRLFTDFCFSKMYEMIGLSEWPTDKRKKS